jgi:hypothetical protein
MIGRANFLLIWRPGSGNYLVALVSVELVRKGYFTLFVRKREALARQI